MLAGTRTASGGAVCASRGIRPPPQPSPCPGEGVNREWLHWAESGLASESCASRTMGRAMGAGETDMRALLDVNVWVALFDDAHLFSAQANEFIETPGLKIATCPMTENGVIRVMNLPGYGRRGALGLAAVRDRLRLACHALDHEFWPDDISLRGDAQVDFSRVHGHQQVTDVYLLALAVKRKGCLVTFDRGVALSAVVGAQPRHCRQL